MVIRTEMDAGPAKARRRFTANVIRVSIAIDLTRTQLGTFNAFFLDTIQGGALPFDWKHPRTGNPVEVRIVGQPTYRPRAPRGDGSEYWRLEFSAELMPGTEVTTAPPVPPASPIAAAITMPGQPDNVWESIADPKGEVDDGSIVQPLIPQAPAAGSTSLILILSGYGSGVDDGFAGSDPEDVGAVVGIVPGGGGGAPSGGPGGFDPNPGGIGSPGGPGEGGGFGQQ